MSIRIILTADRKVRRVQADCLSLWVGRLSRRYVRRPGLVLPEKDLAPDLVRDLWAQRPERMMHLGAFNLHGVAVAVYISSAPAQDPRTTAPVGAGRDDKALL